MTSQRPEDKNAAKRPSANKGGREEEENRPGIASEPLGLRSLRNKKTVSPAIRFTGPADVVMSPPEARQFPEKARATK